MPSNSSTSVAWLTVTALATVGFLTFQASANVPADLAGPHRGDASPTVSKAPRDKEHPAALPGDSGVGERVVYSLDDDRVWLVAANGQVNRTFKVTPGTVDPPPGSYAVTSRASAVTGTDGTPVEHVVRFATVSDVTIGFSAAVDGSPPEPGPTVRTGGVRESPADGDAMWNFATIGEQVVVIP